MNVELVIVGLDKGSETVFLAKGKTSDGRSLITTVVQKGPSAVLQVVKGTPQEIGDNFKIGGWSGNVALLKEGLKAKDKLEFEGVNADVIYVAKSDASKAERLASENEELKKTLEQSNALMAEMNEALKAKKE